MEEVNGYCVDSDILIDYLRGVPNARDFLLRARGRYPLFMSVVSIVEVYAGKETQHREKAKRISEFLGNFDMITLTLVIAKRAGELRRDYQKPFADMIVAATALECRVPLVTRNVKHFGVIKDLEVVKPY